jgi:hypothetical protein
MLNLAVWRRPREYNWPVLLLQNFRIGEAELKGQHKGARLAYYSS